MRDDDLPSAARLAVRMAVGLSSFVALATMGTGILLPISAVVAGRRLGRERRRTVVAWVLAGSVVGWFFVGSLFLMEALAPTDSAERAIWVQRSEAPALQATLAAFFLGVPQIACAALNAVLLGVVPVARPGEPQAQDASDVPLFVAGTFLAVFSALAGLAAATAGTPWIAATVPGVAAALLLVSLEVRSLRALAWLRAASPTPLTERAGLAPLSYRYRPDEPAYAIRASRSGEAFWIPAHPGRARALRPADRRRRCRDRPVGERSSGSPHPGIGGDSPRAVSSSSAVLA